MAGRMPKSRQTAGTRDKGQRPNPLAQDRYSRGGHHRPITVVGKVGNVGVELEAAVIEVEVGRVRPLPLSAPVVLVARAVYEKVFVGYEAPRLGDEVASHLHATLGQFLREQRRLARVARGERVRRPALAVGDRRDKRVEFRGILQAFQDQPATEFEADVIRSELARAVILESTAVSPVGLSELNQHHLFEQPAVVGAGAVGHVVSLTEPLREDVVTEGVEARGCLSLDRIRQLQAREGREQSLPLNCQRVGRPPRGVAVTQLRELVGVLVNPGLSELQEDRDDPSLKYTALLVDALKPQDVDAAFAYSVTYEV